MTDWDDPDDDEFYTDGEDESDPEPPSISEEILSGLYDYFHVESLEDLPITNVADIPNMQDLRGIHFPDLIQAIGYMLKSPAMIPYSTIVDFGDGDYGIAVGDSR